METFKKKTIVFFITESALLCVLTVSQIITCRGISGLSGRIDREASLREEGKRDLMEEMAVEKQGLEQSIAGRADDIKENDERNINETERRIRNTIISRDEGTRAILIEKVVYDYVREGLGHFNDREYIKAHDLFNRASRYRRNDTTIQFYRIYSRYLGMVDDPLPEGELGGILGMAMNLEEAGFRPDEKLEFSEEEMRRKTREIAYNLGEIQKREGGGPP